MNPEAYSIAISLLPRALGIIYFFVFFPFLFQIKGLIGENGILPIETYLTYLKQVMGRKRFYLTPNIFWRYHSDRVLLFTMALGAFLSLLLVFNIYPQIILPLLYVLHLSLVIVGQDFLSFGWELFLLELTVNATLLSWTSPANPFVWISYNLTLFRFYFQGGLSKIFSHDRTWRDLTALAYHYQTQPIPNTQAWYVHKFPIWFHKMSTAVMFFIEIAVPLAMFGNQEMRLWVFIFYTFLQVGIWVTGNFSYLNHLSVAASVILLGDNYLAPIFGPQPIQEPSNLVVNLFVSLCGIALIFLQLANLWNYFRPIEIFYKILHAVQPFFIVNRYGIFAVMTTKRYEIVIEGSTDGQHWHEYLFKHKPSELDRRPRRISPYQPRLDWQAWFLPFSSYQSNFWFQRFLLQLLKNSPPVIKLLRKNPFPDTPPKYIRALSYEYVFSSSEDKKASKVWWKRHYAGFYSPTLSLAPEESD